MPDHPVPATILIVEVREALQLLAHECATLECFDACRPYIKMSEVNEHELDRYDIIPACVELLRKSRFVESALGWGGFLAPTQKISAAGAKWLGDIIEAENRTKARDFLEASDLFRKPNFVLARKTFVNVDGVHLPAYVFEASVAVIFPDGKVQPFDGH